jgi:hypothetical protein
VVEDLILSKGNLFEVGISPAESPDSVTTVYYLGFLGASWGVLPYGRISPAESPDL